MAINLNNLNGQTIGRIGIFTYYMRSGQNIARRLPCYGYNAQTPLQQNNRKSIALLVLFFRQLKPILYHTLNNRPENRAVYHHFLALNLSVSVFMGNFTPGLLVFSGTGLEYTAFSVERGQADGNKFVVTWDTNTLGNKSTNDFLQGIFYSKTRQSFDCSLTKHLRSSGSCELVFNECYKNDECLVYLCFVKADITISSQSSVHAFAAFS